MMKNICKNFMVRQLGFICCLLCVFAPIPSGAVENYVAVATRSGDYSSYSYIFYIPVYEDGSLGYYQTVDDIYDRRSGNSVGVADFDNDGEFDIIYAHGKDSSLYFYRKIGSGAVFSYPAKLVGNFNACHKDGLGCRAGDMAVADFNNDDNMDFLLSGYNSKLQVYLGNGDGTFNPVASVPQLGSNSFMVGKDAEDINNDGFIDVVTASQSGDYLEEYKVHAWLGNGDGTFQSPSLVFNGADLTPENNLTGYGLAVGDFDCDDIPDILLSRESREPSESNKNRLILMTGDNNGGFSLPGLFDEDTYLGGQLPLDRFTFSPVVDSNHDVFFSWSRSGGLSNRLYTLKSSVSGSCDVDSSLYRNMPNYTDVISAVATPRHIGCNDEDGDGFYVSNRDDHYTELLCGNVDCDENNANINSGMVEVCNGIDDNCDGDTDEGFDVDGDGVTTCQGDCNDNDDVVFPGASELCDGKDNNCDGNTDEIYGDSDKDGLADCRDNCPYYANVDQIDLDGDGIGNACDPITVCPSGECDYTKIQDAIDFAFDKATVLVNDGIYVENIDFKGKAITVLTTEVAVIDGGNSGSVVTFKSGEGSGSILDGFTIRNGSALKGGGVYVSSSSSPLITDCTVFSNSATVDGGGVYVVSSSPTIRNSTFIKNTAGVGSAGIHYATGSHGIITNSIISNNSAPVDAGIGCRGGSPTIVHSTITENSATSGGGGIALRDSCNATVVNTIIWSNSAGESGNEIFRDVNSSLHITYSNIRGGYNGEGNGNIGDDPLFDDPPSGKFNLKQGSPCIDTGTSGNALSSDIEGTPRPQDGDGLGSGGAKGDGSDYDMGAYEFPNCTPGTERPCETGLFGICTSGTKICNGEQRWDKCEPALQPVSEVCDGIDNDCDGVIDEGGGLLCDDDNNGCTDNICDPVKGCVYVDNKDQCDDGEICTVNDRCSDGDCNGMTRDCNDDNICTEDSSCILGQGCQYSNNTDSCDDDNDCTTNDTCSVGVCSGVPPEEVCDNIDNDCDGWTDEGCNPPLFDVTVDLVADPIKVCFIPNQILPVNPIVTLKTGNGEIIPTTDTACSARPRHCVNYTPSASDSEVIIEIIEGNPPVEDGSPGDQTASFMIDPGYKRIDYFCLDNEKGGILSSCDTNDELTVELKRRALRNADDTPLQPNPCTLVRVDKLDQPPGTWFPNTIVSAPVDIKFPPGIKIADGRNITVTQKVQLPNGWSWEEFGENLEVYYYVLGNNTWKKDGIEILAKNFTQPNGGITGTVTYTSSHSTVFAASSKCIPSTEVCDGLDNDCDGTIDEDGATLCDDDVGCTDDSCNEDTDSCDNTPINTNCDDDQWCNGAETCDSVNDCQAGTAPDCSDEVSCTADTCNETTDSCDNTPNNTNCDDGQWCNGAETCDLVNDCQAGTAPDCSDGVSCTDDSCNEDTDSCDNTPINTNCDDGQWCNGAETCDPLHGCRSGTAPDCSDDDAIDCTDGSCDEVNDQCVNTPNNANCDDIDPCTENICVPDSENADSITGCDYPTLSGCFYKNTPIGEQTIFGLSAYGFKIWFESVDIAGVTTVFDDGTSGPQLPGNFNLAGNYYNITTTASFSGRVEVCIYYYDDSNLQGLEEDLQLLHYNTDDNPNHWEETDQYLDFDKNIICGFVTDLSPFAPASPPVVGPIDVDGDGHPQSTDCNDNDPNINPVASEVCGDAIDNNCDGATDEGCSQTQTASGGGGGGGGGGGCSIARTGHNGSVASVVANILVFLSIMLIPRIRKKRGGSRSLDK